jgi:aryl-alcohol dehydrogenase-like predicted oxidoreductase
MEFLSIAGLPRACSRLVLGSVEFSPSRQRLTDELLDAFVALGGTLVDTAHVYNGGDSERALGDWLKRHQDGSGLMILGKGAHPDRSGSRVRPDVIAQDLMESLERLQVSAIDLYMLHRDDVKVPVGEIMDALNEQVAAGRVRVLGVSNWTPERIDEANQYANRRGLKPLAASSPNLSLAKPREPRWAGCVSVDDAQRDWYQMRQFPLFSWSSQAGGFFTGRFSPNTLDDPEMVRTYYTDANWARYHRAGVLAQSKQVDANQIALAYVLRQPFPTAALIGSASVDELASSAKALSVSLTAEEVRWLEEG